MNHTLQSGLGFLAVLTTLALTAVSTPAQPAPDDQAVAAGRKRFAALCGACHGESAAGGRGSDLTTGNWKWGGSDSEIILNIRKGIPGTQMPPFTISEDEAKEIVAYLRTLSGETHEPVTGDPEAGRKLFFGSAGCIGCHFFGGAGGRLGPDLTKIRDEKNVGDLRKAITDPSDSLRPSFETIEVEFPEDRPVRRGGIGEGRRLEDHSAPGRLRQRRGTGRRGDLRPSGQQVHQPFGRPGRALEVAHDLA